MSLDLSNKAGRAHNTTPVTDPSTLVLGTIDSGDVATAGSFLVTVDTTGGAVDLGTTPTSLLDANGAEIFCDGFEITFVKVSTEKNVMTFLDPITTVNYAYADRQGESFTMVMDTSTGSPQWVAKV